MTEISTKFFYYSNRAIEDVSEFSKEELNKESKKIPSVQNLIEEMGEKGFRYVGAPESDSKAYTDIEKKQIFISKNATLNEAILSITYELINAKNQDKFKKVFAEYLHDPYPTQKRAEEYSSKILKIEAEAVFLRSFVALSLGLVDSIKNPIYLDLVKGCEKPSQESINKIHDEMLVNGKVHKGTKRAFDHYVAQYYKFNKSR